MSWSSGEPKVSVLIVDDSKRSRGKLAEILERNGYEIAGYAGDGREAMALYEELVPDVVTMDIVMPEVNGIDAVRAITDFDPGAIVIMVSSWGTAPRVMEAVEAGAQNFILKPFAEDKITNIFESTLNKYF